MIIAANVDNRETIAKSIALLLHAAYTNNHTVPAVFAQRAPPVATTQCGAVSGTWIEDVSVPAQHDLAAFYSIPYGSAPVGNMRWMPPVNATCLAAEAPHLILHAF